MPESFDDPTDELSLAQARLIAACSKLSWMSEKVLGPVTLASIGDLLAEASAAKEHIAMLMSASRGEQ